MLRSSTPRTVMRTLNAAASLLSSRAATRRAPAYAQLQSQLHTWSSRPQSLMAAKPMALQLLRTYATEGRTISPDTIDRKHESELAKQKLPVDPSVVSLESSVHPILGEVGGEAKKDDDTNMMAGINADIQTIKDTFSLEDVPRQAYYIGLAGVLPYVATSLSTVFCASEIHRAAEYGSGYLLSDKTAELTLHILEPLQVGYGATIISFLGAIHWGLEFAKYGGSQGYSRYSIGVVGTALAWPTILFPVEYALISQFLIFNFLYYTDSRASKRGWAPAWYGVYRFVLTFIVGSSIVVSLIGRGQISDRIGRLPGPADRIKQLREQQAVEAENEEEARRKFLASKEEEDDE